MCCAYLEFQAEILELDTKNTHRQSEQTNKRKTSEETDITKRK
jgi:hypothetical protein